MLGRCCPYTSARFLQLLCPPDSPAGSPYHFPSKGEVSSHTSSPRSALCCSPSSLPSESAAPLCHGHYSQGSHGLPWPHPPGWDLPVLVPVTHIVPFSPPKAKHSMQQTHTQELRSPPVLQPALAPGNRGPGATSSCLKRAKPALPTSLEHPLVSRGCAAMTGLTPLL